MERSGDLAERLEAWICRPKKGIDEEPLYKEITPPDPVVIVERDKAGEAEVSCQIPDGCMCIEWKLLAIAGVLGVQIRTAILATAYRNDMLSEEESPNPTLGKPLLDAGAPRGPAEAEITGARLQQLAWMKDEVRLLGFAHPFRHVKIQLDEATGRATHRIS